MARRALTFADRADIAVGMRLGKKDRQIGEDIGREHTIIWRERRRDSTKTHGYRPETAGVKAERRRKRPQVSKVDADPATPLSMVKSPDADGRTVSHEALYRWIHALPRVSWRRTASCCDPSEPAANRARPPVNAAHRSRAWSVPMTGPKKHRTAGFPAPGKRTPEP